MYSGWRSGFCTCMWIPNMHGFTWCSILNNQSMDESCGSVHSWPIFATCNGYNPDKSRKNIATSCKMLQYVVFILPLKLILPHHPFNWWVPYGIKSQRPRNPWHPSDPRPILLEKWAAYCNGRAPSQQARPQRVVPGLRGNQALGMGRFPWPREPEGYSAYLKNRLVSTWTIQWCTQIWSLAIEVDFMEVSKTWGHDRTCKMTCKIIPFFGVASPTWMAWPNYPDPNHLRKPFEKPSDWLYLGTNTCLAMKKPWSFLLNNMFRSPFANELPSWIADPRLVEACWRHYRITCWLLKSIYESLPFPRSLAAQSRPIRSRWSSWCAKKLAHTQLLDDWE